MLRTDGAARGNPGPAGVGAVLEEGDTGRLLRELSAYVGSRTNNQAEYEALLLGLRAALEDEPAGPRPPPPPRVRAFLDSQLVVRQLQGRYRVKDPELAVLFAESRRLIERLAGFECRHVPREQNQRADELANEAIDAHLTLQGSLKASEPRLCKDPEGSPPTGGVQ